MNNKKLNKKKIITVVAIVLAVALIVTIILFMKKGQNSVITESQKLEENQEVATGEYNGEPENFNIKSTEQNPIEKNGIEAESIDFNVIGNDLEVTTTLKNNTKEDLNGYLIEIEFLNDNGETVTTIVDNSPDVIKPKETKTITNYIMELQNPKQITSAKIISLEKSSMGESLEQTFDEMTPDLDNLEQEPTE